MWCYENCLLGTRTLLENVYFNHDLLSLQFIQQIWRFPAGTPSDNVLCHHSEDLPKNHRYAGSSLTFLNVYLFLLESTTSSICLSAMTSMSSTCVFFTVTVTSQEVSQKGPPWRTVCVFWCCFFGFMNCLLDSHAPVKVPGIKFSHFDVWCYLMLLTCIYMLLCIALQTRDWVTWYLCEYDTQGRPVACNYYLNVVLFIWTTY